MVPYGAYPHDWHSIENPHVGQCRSVVQVCPFNPMKQWPPQSAVQVVTLAERQATQRSRQLEVHRLEQS